MDLAVQNFLKLKTMEQWWDHKLSLPDKNAHILTYNKYQAWREYIRNPTNCKKEKICGEGLEQRKRVL